MLQADGQKENQYDATRKKTQDRGRIYSWPHSQWTDAFPTLGGIVGRQRLLSGDANIEGCGNSGVL